MQYSNFKMRNNVHATLSTALSSVATTIQLTTGQGARFGTEFPQIATLESFDDTGKVVKREIVQITARNNDDLTVVRAFAPCPANDDANSQSQSSVSFSADDTISLYIPKEIFDKIHNSMNDIYDNGTNNMRTDLVSGLQVEVNPGSVLVGSSYYNFAGGTITLTDDATNYLEIDEDGNLVNNTTGRNDDNAKLAIITTISGSVTNIQDWRLGTIGGKIGGVNIHDLTEKPYISPNDEFIITDSDNIYQNKKVKYSTIGLDTKFDYPAGENISAGDVLELTDGITTIGSATEYIEFGSTTQQELSKPVIGSGNVGDNLLIRCGKINATDDIKVRIETDNNGLPSGTLFNANAEYTISNANISAQQNQFAPVVVENSSSINFTGYWFGCKFTVETTMYISGIITNTAGSPNYTVDFKLGTLSGNTYTITNTETSLTRGSTTGLKIGNYYWLLSTPIKLTPGDYVYYFSYKDENNQVVNYTHHEVYRKGHYDVQYLTNMNNVISDVADLGNSGTISLINTDYVGKEERPVFIAPTLTDINIDLSNITLTANTNYHIVIKRSGTNSDDDKFYLAKTSTGTISDRLKYKDVNGRNNSNSYYGVSNSAFFSRAYIKATQINGAVKIATQDVLAGNIVPYASNGKIGLYTNLTALTSYYLDSNDPGKITDTFGDYYVGEALSDNILYIDSTPNLPVYIGDGSKTTFTIKRSGTYKVSCMFGRESTSTSLQNYNITFTLNSTTIEAFDGRYPTTKIGKQVYFTAKCGDVLTITTTGTSVSISQLIMERLIVNEGYVE